MSNHLDPVVSVKRLCVRFGRRTILDGLDLDVPRGSVTALVGRNGAGKSTLLRVLVGALVPQAGTVRVLGLDPAREGPRVRARIGYVPDHIDVPSWMRARDWLAFVERFYPSWNELERRRWLDILALDDGSKVSELSKGARTKLALVAALSHGPELLLLDEPFSGLDVGVRHAITTAVLTSLRDESRSVLLVSHSIPDLERLADRVAVLSDGRIERAGELEVLGRTERGGVDLESTLLALPAAGGSR
jgi:ABC-2 type transport system ATP-binding protein